MGVLRWPPPGPLGSTAHLGPGTCWIARAAQLHVKQASSALHLSIQNPAPPQAKEAINHPYFDDLDKVTVDALESQEVRDRMAEAAAANVVC